VAGRKRVPEQHIAVFGGSGSGKTVLVSSFYGAAQELEFLEESLFHVIADDTSQGNLLRSNYLGMKKSKAPEATRFSATPYRFKIQPKHEADNKAAKSKPFDALRLVWHDYPGEWFEEEPSSDEERARRLHTFRLLLRSDVAFILIDGQKLIDYAGEEERYLKSILGDIRDGLLRLKKDLLDDDGSPLERFPRIWITALSKADLHPGLGAHDFQDLVIEKAAGDIAALRQVIRGMVQLPDALSVGDDFMLLSSARFEPGRIQVADRVGLNLVLPVALLLPLERLVDWLNRFEIPRVWLDRLAENASAFAGILVGARALALINRIPKVGPLLASIAVPAMVAAAELGGPKVKEINAEARAKQDYLTAILSQFRLDLDQGERDDVFVKRPQ
jgi:hypothetical protein